MPRNPDLGEASYFAVIHRKTAKLFEAAAQLGAVLGGASPEAEAALARYGMHLGTAFQLVDDVLDYSGDLAAIGKNLGDDLAEGKMTLPLIRAIAVGGDEAGTMIRGAITEGRLDDFGPIAALLARTGALDYTRVPGAGGERARRRLPRAPAAFPVSRKSARIVGLCFAADVLTRPSDRDRGAGRPSRHDTIRGVA